MRAVPSSIARPEYVGRKSRPARTGSEVKDDDTDRARCASPARIAGAGARRGRAARRSRRHHRRARPGRPRVPLRPRRLPVDARLQGLPPEVAVHQRQRGHLPRHPGQHRARRTATSSTSTSPRSSAACTATPTRPTSSATSTRSHGCWSSAPHEAMMRGIKAVAPGRADQRHRSRHRVVRAAVRLRRRARLHRARHRHVVPLRAGHPALRRPRATTVDGDRA